MNQPLLGALAASLVVVTACGGGGASSTGAAPAATAVVSHGTITGFGSVIIDGLRYETSRAQFSVDGTSGRSQDDLSVGQRVTVRGTINDDGSRSAGEVAYEAELHGIVASVDLAAGSFVALGQTIVVDASTIFSGVSDLSGLAADNYIEVSGSRTADGSILASYVEKESARSELEVKGVVLELDATLKQLTIGSQLVDYSTATVPTGLTLANGSFVEVKGTLVGSVLMATRIAQEDDFRSGDRGTLAEVEGLVGALAEDRGSFRIGPTLVTVSGSTVYEGGSAAPLVEGVKLEAKGTVQADGSLAATRIEFKLSSHGGGDDNGGTFGAEAKIQATITALDASARNFSVLGVTVKVADTTVYRDSRDEVRSFGYSGLAVGDYVELGLVEIAGELTASKVERDDNDSRQLVQAAVDSIDAVGEVLAIAGIAVDASTASYKFNDATVSAEQFYATVAVGSKLKAKGSYNGTMLVATEVELDVED